MVAMKKTRSGEELRWQAESDAQTMATYQEIMGDKTRMNRAIKVARSQAADLTKRANAMQNVAKTKSSKRKQFVKKKVLYKKLIWKPLSLWIKDRS